MHLWFRCLLMLWFGCCLSPGAQAAPLFEDNMAQRTLACTACHGNQGRAGPDGYYPRLAGKPAGYLYQQLVNFREGRRHYPLMLGLLDTLDDASLHRIADYFSGLSLPYPPPKPAVLSAAEGALGRTLVQEGDPARGIPACTQCHGLLLTGVQPDTPGLLGLPSDYLNAQLGGWQTGQRRAAAPDCMAKIAQSLSAAEISALAHWLSAQPVPANARAAEQKPPATPARIALACGSDAKMQPVPVPVPASSATKAPTPAAAALLARGAYLARIANCAPCHSARGKAPYAGGRALATPFGAVLSSNITPDPVQGIGQWTADDFWRALHHGESRDGRALYPAFPYTSYTRISRTDSDALFAFLKSLPPSNRANQPHALRWPYSSPWALRAWRALFFSPAAAPVTGSLPPSKEEWQRGEYLVQGPGHCMACHGARNALGAWSDRSSTDGFVLPGSQWWAPSLSDTAGASVAHWSEREIASFLTSGRNDLAVARGPMAEVVLHGTQYLTAADAQAMARYLKTLPQTPPGVGIGRSPASGQASEKGRKIYETHCADCHGLQGAGRAGAYPALAANRAVTQAPANNLIHTVLGGGFAPATASNPQPYGMPPFLLQLGDAEIASVLSYIRNAWGNRAPAVSEFDINKLRRSQAP